MSPKTSRPLQLKLPLVLQLDMVPHGRTVRVCDATGRELGTLDRPFAEWLVALLDQVRMAA